MKPSLFLMLGGAGLLCACAFFPVREKSGAPRNSDSGLPARSGNAGRLGADSLTFFPLPPSFRAASGAELRFRESGEGAEEGWKGIRRKTALFPAPVLEARAGVSAAAEKPTVRVYETEALLLGAGSSGLSAAPWADAVGVLFGLVPEKKRADCGNFLSFTAPPPSWPGSARQQSDRKTGKTARSNVRDTVARAGLLHAGAAGLTFFLFEGRAGGKTASSPPSCLERYSGLSLALDPHGEIPEAPKDPARRTSQRDFAAALHNARGLLAVADSAFDPALASFEEALRLRADREDFLVNASAVYRIRGDHAGGIALLNKYPDLLKQSAELCGILGAMHEDLGRFAEARSWALRALDKDPANEEWLINLSDALWGLGERAFSKNVLLRQGGDTLSFRLGVYLASTHLGLEEYDAALTLLEDLHRKNRPSALSVEYQLRALLGLKRYAEMIAYLETPGPDSLRSTPIHFLRGMAEFQLKLYREASRSLALALKGDPNHREAGQLATRLAALLGYRSNLILREHLAPLPVPQGLERAASLWRRAQASPRLRQSPFILLEQHVVFSFSPGRKWRKTRLQTFGITDGSKLGGFSELNFDLNPGYSRFFVNSCRYFDEKLRPVDQGRLGDYYITRNHNTTLHPENLLVHIAIRPRSTLRFLQVITTEEANEPAGEVPYLRYDRRHPYPVIQDRFEVPAPLPAMRVQTFGAARADTTRRGLTLTIDEETPAFEAAFSAAAEEFGSGFTLSSESTWDEVGREYLGQLARAGRHLDSIPFEARDKALRLSWNLGPRETAQRLFAHVRDSLRYDNYEFGLHALLPEPADKVLGAGYGDCKGHAFLLAQMLRSRGLRAGLFLVSLDHPGDISQPTLHQFNHMIVHVPKGPQGEALFLDPTEKFQPFRPSPLALEGKVGLVIEPGGSQVAAIPEADLPEEHRADIHHRVKVEGRESAAGVDSVRLTGKLAAEFRSRMRGWNETAKRENLLSWLAEGYGNLAEGHLAILNEERIDSPLVIVLRYRQRFLLEEGRREFYHHPRLELGFLRFPKAAGRKNPVAFPHEVLVRAEWVYELPGGFRWISPTLDRELSESHLHWRLVVEQDAPETLRLRQSWRLDPFAASPEDYAAIERGWTDLLRQAGLRLSTERS